MSIEIIPTSTKNQVLRSMEQLLVARREDILAANQKDLQLYAASPERDQAMYDRLVADSKKIDEMIQAIREVASQPDPVDKIIEERVLENELKIINKTAPFGTILIIYESRPDVTVEAAALAFKAGNKILLKGGKEAVYTNTALVRCWQDALKENRISTDHISLLTLDRPQTRAFLKEPPQKLDLIVPRGGEGLIRFVKENATCPVLVSGRGNNFLYIHSDASWGKAIHIILNAKTQKISACNALDKVLINTSIPGFQNKVKVLYEVLHDAGVTIYTDPTCYNILEGQAAKVTESQWSEEFLAMKLVLGAVPDMKEAVRMINIYSGGHSAAIISEDSSAADTFMKGVDCAAVYHNASTRFTDGGQMGIGAELAISTDKLHHRGPLGLKQLVTNKYYIFGNGHIRK